MNKFKQHIETQFPNLQQKKLLLALSGGLDSVVLAHILKSLDYNIALAHVNFHLRDAESDGDETFVRELATTWQVPIFVHQAQTQQFADQKKISIQMAARDIRYQWFNALIHQHGFHYLLTAHHLDDHIETFFINLNRKSGLEGLTGIPEKNAKILRPLLPFSRSELLQYATDKQLVWREDSSNASVKYERNKIRHQLFPVLEDLNPDFRKDFGKSIEYLNHANTLIKDYLNVLKPHFWHQKQNEIHIYLMELKKVNHYEYVLFELLKPYGFTDWQSIFELINTQSGKKIVSENYILYKDRIKFILTEKVLGRETQNKINIENNIQIGNFSYRIERFPFDTNLNFKKKGIEYLDAEKVVFPLYIKRWEDGDAFIPLGMKGSKKLSDYFRDLKLNVIEKSKIWLLCDAQNRILWVVGYRIDERFKVTEQTKEIIKIQTL